MSGFDIWDIMRSRRASFRVAGEEGRPHINIRIMGGDGVWRTQKILADSGNDITLLNATDGIRNRLGMGPGESFAVEGIADATRQFRMDETWIQIGDLKPIKIPLGVEQGQQQLEDSLLGREGAMEKYTVVYTGDQVIFLEKETGESCGVDCL